MRGKQDSFYNVLAHGTAYCLIDFTGSSSLEQTPHASTKGGPRFRQRANGMLACEGLQFAQVRSIAEPYWHTIVRQWLFANVTIDYVRQAHYPGEVTIATGLTRVGSSSYVVGQAAFQDHRCFALAEAIMVKAIDGKPSPLSDGERTTMQTLTLAL